MHQIGATVGVAYRLPGRNQVFGYQRYLFKMQDIRAIFYALRNFIPFSLLRIRALQAHHPLARAHCPIFPVATGYDILFKYNVLTVIIISVTIDFILVFKNCDVLGLIIL